MTSLQAGLAVFLLAVCAAALVRIAVAMAAGELRGPQGLPGQPGPPGQALPVEHPVLAPNGARRDVSEVLKSVRGQWLHHGWVETGSHAYDLMLRAKGYAVRPHGQEIDFGNQE